MLVVPGRLVYACPVVRHIFQVWGARVVQWWEYSPPTNVARFKSRRRRHMWVEFVVGSLPCSERFFSGCSGFPLSSKTNISKFQFDQESGRRRTTMWMCYLQIVIYFYLFIIYFTGLRVLVSFVPSVFLLRGVFQPISPSPSPPLPVVLSSPMFFVSVWRHRCQCFVSFSVEAHGWVVPLCKP